MSGNYRPRRRYGASGNPKAPRGTGNTGKANEVSAAATAAAEGTTPRTGPGAPAGKQGAPRARNAAGEPAAGRRNPARRAGFPRPADPRRTAYDVLAAVRDREAYANLLLPRLLAERQLGGRDAALATELAYGTLRGQGTYDAILAACSDRPLDKLDPPVLDILRLGTHQLLNTRIGAHAAVATSVDLAKSVVGPRVSGYVNAVLRRVATRDLPAWLDIVAPDATTDPDGYLATRYSHPRWIVAAYRAALGAAADDPAPATAIPGAPADAQSSGPSVSTKALAAGNRDAEARAGTARAADAEPTEGVAEPTGEVAATGLAAVLAAGNARPRVTMATFPAGPPREDVMPADAEPGRWSPYAFTLRSGDPAPLADAGTAAVQDEASQLAAIALARAPVTPRAGHDARAGQGDGGQERWLDLCAGPGGKSRLLYGLAAGSGATLTAAELHPHRAALVKDALTRASRLTGSAPSAPGEANRGPGAPEPPDSPGTDFEVVVADGTRPPWPDGTFDRVLVDAPCSGLGALRRRPEARWRKSQADLKELTALQRDLLGSALASVRPGGVVAYVTCSPVPAETSDVIADVTASMPGVEVIDAPAVLAEVPGTRAADPLFAQLWPHRHGTDAIFIALLRRGTK
jgi:16S rRNA (cytosine967-C5)-methyltransferase